MREEAFSEKDFETVWLLKKQLERYKEAVAITRVGESEVRVTIIRRVSRVARREIGLICRGFGLQPISDNSWQGHVMKWEFEELAV